MYHHRCLQKCPPSWKDLQSFTDIMSYCNKDSPVTAEICGLLRRLISVKEVWTWNKANDELYNKAKALIRKDAWMTFYNKREPLYLEIDASSVGLEAGHMQIREGINCPHGEAPDNMALCPTTYTQHMKQIRNAPSLLFSLQSQFNCRSQTIGSYLQKGCNNTVTVTGIHPTTHTPIQITHIIQAWARAVHYGLAVTTKPLWEQRYFWHEPKHQCYGNPQRHPRMHVNTWYMRHSAKWWTFISANNVHHKGWLLSKAEVRQDI